MVSVESLSCNKCSFCSNTIPNDRFMTANLKNHKKFIENKSTRYNIKKTIEENNKHKYYGIKTMLICKQCRNIKLRRTFKNTLSKAKNREPIALSYSYYTVYEDRKMKRKNRKRIKQCTKSSKTVCSRVWAPHRDAWEMRNLRKPSAERIKRSFGNKLIDKYNTNANS